MLAPKMKKSFVSVFIPMLLASLLSASTRSGPNSPETPQAVNLLPEPKEMTVRVGEFRLGKKTRILVQLGHQEEDRIAAETLAEDIADHAGLKIDIAATKISSKAEDGAIMLVRLQDARVRRFLAARGLQANAALKQQGYLLFSDESHLIVAANTGQGLFSGVQTLRQLFRADGRNFVCPAVAIRDWPDLEGDAALVDDENRDTVVRILGPGN
jgi:N-acetyl-beta-hexosaminidase